MMTILVLAVCIILPVQCSGAGVRIRSNNANTNNTRVERVDNAVVRGCEDNTQCLEWEYCSAGTCRAFGMCATLNDCLNPSNVYRTVRCLGYLYCSRGGYCDLECSGTFCPEHELEFAFGCDQPCSRSTFCRDQSRVSCANNICGGCNAVYFDAAGNQVCGRDGISDNACTNNLDCPEGKYCAAGECLDVGLCKTDVDCHNPENGNYIEPRCNGPLRCDDGFCSKSCNGCPSYCSDQGGNMRDPCSLSTCDDPDAICVNDYCKCEAIFFGPAGDQKCRNDGTLFGIPGLLPPPPGVSGLPPPPSISGLPP